jgi:flagellar hook-associated protein 3 FlgL
MNITSLGDMAQSYAMKSRNGILKNDIQRLTLELSSGQVADVRKAIGGDSTYLNDLDRNLKRLEGYSVATREAAQLTTAAQNVLSRVGNLNSELRDALIGQGGATSGAGSDAVLALANNTLTSMISALNTDVGGRAVFAGTASGAAAMAPSDILLTGLTIAVSGATSVNDMLAAAQFWFDDPSGFGSMAYLGSNSSLAPFSLSDGQTASFDLRGDDPALRETLMAVALVALADDSALGLNQSQQSELLEKSLSFMLSANDSIVDLQAGVGLSEQAIDTAMVRNAAQKTSLQIARNDLLGVNPYEAATELEQVQFQLQSLYAITSRMSQLSLVNYL